MEKGYIPGVIKDNILAIGKIIKWMDMACSRGQMEENIKAIIKMIKRMDMVYSNGPMAKSIKVIGLMGNKMVKGNFIMIRLKRGENVLFKMEEESDGLMNN